MLNAAGIIAEAESRVGIEDSDPSVRGNLEHLLASLKRSGDLSPDGEALSERLFIMDAVNRLQGQKWVRDYPEIAAEKISAPVFLMGLPRSGTTYFQYLFDRDVRFRLIRTWESMAPNPPPGFDPESVKTRRAAWAQMRAQQPSFEGFEALHLYDQDGSDECHAFLQQSYGAAGLHNLFRAPEYFDYLLDELDLVETYHIHKQQLQLLQWRSPAKPWALKYPNHVIAMNEILQVYPDARFVMTHRDPVQTLASISKMTFNLRKSRASNSVDPTQVGADMLHFVQRHIDRIMAFDKGDQGARVVHVDYYSLIDNPVAEMRRIHTGIGMDTPMAIAETVGAWHRDNPKNARGKNDYTLEQWGLVDSAVAEQFSDYMRRFNIPREKDGARPHWIVTGVPAKAGNWDAINEAVTNARAAIANAAPDATIAAEGDAYVMRVLTACLSDAFVGHLMVEGGLSRALPVRGGPNPDYLMVHAGLDPARRYRLEGKLNASERVGVGVYSFGAGGSADISAYAAFDKSNVDAEGRFALDVAADAQGPGSLPIAPDARVIMMRTLHRESKGEPARLTLDGGPPLRDLTVAQGNMAAAFGQVANALTNSIRTFLEWTHVTSAAKNSFHAETPSMTQNVQGDPDTIYFLGSYDLGDGEWLDVTIPAGIPGYWSLHAYNHWCESLPGAGIGDNACIKEADGRIRIAISPSTSTNAPNRIDTLGRKRGALIFRAIGAHDLTPPAAIVRR